MAFLLLHNYTDFIGFAEAADTGDGSGGETVPGAGLCCCDEAAGKTGKEDLCPILPGNDGK